MLEATSNGHLEDLHGKYYKKITKRAEKQNGPAKTLVWRTSMTAMEVLDELADIPFEKLTSSLYFISLDLDTKELTRKYEAMLELAGVAPDKFIDSLHKDLNSLSDFVKRNHLLPELFEMIAVCDRVRYNCHRKIDSMDDSTIHIMNAYQSVLLQTLEYLRPSKFNFNVAVCGCSTDGEILTVPEYYPKLDSISHDLEEKISNGKKFSSMGEFNTELRRVTAKYGYPEITTFDQLQTIINSDRLLTNQRLSLAAYINEFTYDMVPKPDTAFNGNFGFLAYIHLRGGVNIAQIKAMLKKRARTLPANGVVFKFDYNAVTTGNGIPEDKRISQVKFKETYHDDHIVMLYNIVLSNNQVVSGYFDTSTQFLSSLFLGTNSLEQYIELYTTSQSMLLYLYAAATSRNMEQMLSDLNTMMYAADESAHDSKMSIMVTGYLSGGKPINHYNSSNTGSRVNDERYEAVSRPIQGYIRHLPAGQSASKEAKDRALALGFDLQPDETYVQPFIKNVLRLRGKT